MVSLQLQIDIHCQTGDGLGKAWNIVKFPVMAVISCRDFIYDIHGKRFFLKKHNVEQVLHINVISHYAMLKPKGSTNSKKKMFLGHLPG